MDAKQEFVYDIALVCVQHLRNALKFKENTGEQMGGHSRFMENLVHPEDYFLLCGKSKEYI